MQVINCILVFLFVTGVQFVTGQSEFNNGETLDPAAQEARLAAAEEHLAETISESAVNSPERQQVEQTIRQSGGKFSGDAAALNYLIDEHYHSTTPAPPTIHVPIKPPAFLMGNRGNRQFHGGRNSPGGPDLRWRRPENGMRQRDNFGPRDQWRKQGRNNHGPPNPDRWPERQRGSFNRRGQGGRRRQQHTNDPWEQTPSSRGPWGPLRNDARQNRNVSYRWNQQRIDRPPQDQWSRFTTHGVPSTNDPWLEQTTPLMNIKPRPDKRPNHWRTSSQNQFGKTPPQSHAEFIKSLSLQDLPLQPGTNWQSAKLEPKNILKQNTKWGPPLHDIKAPSQSNTKWRSQLQEPRRTSSQTNSNTKLEPSQHEPNTPFKQNIKWGISSLNLQTSTQRNDNPLSELIHALLFAKESKTPVGTGQTLKAPQQDQIKKSNTNTKNSLLQMVASQTPSIIDPAVTATNLTDSKKTNTLASVTTELQKAASQTANTVSPGVQGLKMIATQTPNTVTGKFIDLFKIQTANGVGTTQKDTTTSNSRQQVFQQLFDALFSTSIHRQPV